MWQVDDISVRWKGKATEKQEQEDYIGRAEEVISGQLLSFGKI